MLGNLWYQLESWWYAFSVLALPVLPPHTPAWAGLLVLLALVFTAAYDARTGLVPVIPLYASALLIVFLVVWDEPFRSWAGPLLPAFAFYGAIWLLNAIWFSFTRRDAIGLGDATWSFVACLAYGWHALVAAWGAGAIMAIVVLQACWLAHRPRQHVHFVPFLLIGLMLDIFWIKL